MTIIPNFITDDLRKIIDPPVDNLTGANYVTVTPNQQVLPPSGQDVDPDSLKQMALDYNSMVDSELAAHLWEFDPRVLMRNPAQPEPGVTPDFSVGTLLADPHNLPPHESS